MSPRVPYDGFADIYDAWVDSVPIADQMRAFYVEELRSADEGPIVELGVGNGRICVEVARSGRPIIGVDSSRSILELCRERAESADAAAYLELIEADFRNFEIARPATLVTIPFHSIGHLPTEADKRRCMEQVYSQLAPGGALVWDHFVFDPDFPIQEGTPHLRADIRREGGRRQLIWETAERDLERQMIDLLVRVEELDGDDVVDSARYVRMEMSWIDPARSRELLEEVGFEIEALYGNFDRGPFESTSSHQVWRARRPT